METSIVDFEKILEGRGKVGQNPLVMTLIKELSKRTSAELISNLEEDTEEKIAPKIRKEVYRVKPYSEAQIKEKQLLFQETVNTLSELLHQAILENDLKKIIVFLCFQSYLSLPLNLYLNQVDYDQTGDLAQKIVNVLQEVQIQIRQKKGAQLHEVEQLSESQDGISERNIQKTYKLVEAMECHLGFMFNTIYEHLFHFLAEINPASFSDLVCSIKHPYNAIFFLQNSSLNELIYISELSGIHDSWTIFEVLRQILDFHRDNRIEPNEPSVEAVRTLLIKLHSADPSYFRQAISYFHRRELFNIGLGRALAELPQEIRRDVLENLLEINSHESLVETRNLLFDSFNEVAIEEDCKDFLLTVYLKWEKYRLRFLRGEETYLDDLLLTDYWDLVSRYFMFCVAQDDIEQFVLKSLNNVLSIDSEWAENELAQKVLFYAFTSELYLLSFAYSHNKVENKQIRSDGLTLFKNKILEQRFIKGIKKNYWWEKMRENLGLVDRIFGMDHE